MLDHLPVLLAVADPITGIILVAAVGVYSFVTWYSRKKKSHDLKAHWRMLADIMQWSFSEKDSPTGEITAQFGPITVTAYSHLNQLGTEPNAYTYIVAKLPSPSNFFIKLTPETSGAALREMLGQQEIIIGDYPFDSAFNIQSNNALLCKLWLNEKMRALILAAAPYQFYLANGELSLVREGFEEFYQMVNARIKDAVKLASQGQEITEKWRKLSSDLHADPTEQHQIPEVHISALLLERRGIPCLVRVSATKTSPITTSISTNHPHNAGNFTIRESSADLTAMTLPSLLGFELKSTNLEKAQQILTQELIDLLRGLPLVSLEVGLSGIEVLLRGFAPPTDKVELALDVCAELATKSQGPYR